MSPPPGPEAPVTSAPEPGLPARKTPGLGALKTVFALEYVLQGLANPFQGVTYQPFFLHLRGHYGMSEAAVQKLFARSYLAWSFKPLIGFLVDAYGRTRTLLVWLLVAGVLGYLLTPLVDTGPLVFFGSMFLVSVAFAATDVAVDRATVIAGDEEAKATGRSKATTVGLNQAICWLAIYGTGIVAAVLGGYLAEHFGFIPLMLCLAAVPALVLVAVLRLPPDRAAPIPLRRSLQGFWQGLHTGPILGVMLFYFVFHFQPAMGALWNDHLIQHLKFSQTEVGISDGAANVGYVLGVVWFAWKGVKWQDRLGLRRLFRIYIAASIVLSLTQYMLVDPWFSAVTGRLSAALPFWREGTVRLAYLCVYNASQGVAASLIRMSTFSVVGAVIPVAAAGSLFAGFMSVANLAYAFSYSSGSWLYESGSQFAAVRQLEQAVFGIPVAAGEHLSISMLLLINTAAYLLSFLCVHLLPDQRETAATEADKPAHPGPERWQALGARLCRSIDLGAWAFGAGLLSLCVFAWDLDAISATMMSFFATVLLRKALLDSLLKRRAASA